MRADCVLSDFSPRLFHARDANGRHEVDVVAELQDGRIIGIEIKASASAGPADARHLRWLKDGVGSMFALGIVFHTGPRPIRLDDRIWAMPICALWG